LFGPEFVLFGLVFVSRDFELTDMHHCDTGREVSTAVPYRANFVQHILSRILVQSESILRV